ncbi:MAG: SPFH domain-containing protein [Halothece sp.]
MRYWLTFLQTLPQLSEEGIDVARSPEGRWQSQSRSEDANQNLNHQRQDETQEVAELPSSAQPTLAQSGFSIGSGLIVPASIVVGIVILLILTLLAYKSIYRITPSNAAFVRTGGLFTKKKEVILNGGCLILPGFHELTRVPLVENFINVERTDELAVRTKDYLRANIRATFYVCIQENEEDVRQAANRMAEENPVGGNHVTEDKIQQALETRADDAIRAAAKQKTLAEIDSDKLGFAEEVQNLVAPDLKQIGITLNNIAIAEIEESGTYNESNYFDSLGLRTRTETIQQSIREKQDVEMTTRVQMEKREKDAEKESLAIAKEQEEAKMNQQLEVESMKAQREREMQEAKDKEATQTERNQILQEKAVEEEKIQRRQSEQERQNEADIAIAESNKQLQVSQSQQKQESETAQIQQQQAVDAARLRAKVEVAEAEQESKTAQEESSIAIARKEQERLEAEAERAKSEGSVETAKQVEEAERKQRLASIEAQQEAEQKRISEQNVVELEAFRRRRQAESSKEAAELEAESTRTLAQANRDKALAEAEGKRALIEAENAEGDANRTERLISNIWPDLAPQLPGIMQALAPQPGVLGDTRIYAFPGANGDGNGNNMGEINKLLLSTSGFSLLNSFLEEGKIDSIAEQIKQLLRQQGLMQNETSGESSSDYQARTATLSENQSNSETPSATPTSSSSVSSTSQPSDQTSDTPSRNPDSLESDTSNSSPGIEPDETQSNR